MDIFQKVTDWLVLVLLAIAGKFWSQLSETRKDLAATREQMATRPELGLLTQLVASTRETAIARPELTEAIRDFKAEVARVYDKVDSMEQLSVVHAGKASKFRHILESHMLANNLNMQQVADRLNIKLVRPEQVSEHDGN